MMTMTKEPPPLVVDPKAERLLVGDMLEIRDMILDCAVKVSDARGVPIKRVRILQWEDACDGEYVDFQIHLVCDQETAFDYWDGVGDAIDKRAESMSEEIRHALIYRAGVSVEWR